MKAAQLLSSLVALVRRRLKLIARIILGGLLLVACGIFATPMISVEIGTRRAMQCLALYQAPHPPEDPPSCTEHMQWFVKPSRTAWTRHSATYRAEEFYARMAWFDYLDAAVSKPNPEKLKNAGKRIKEVEEIVKKGSQRHSMEDLGQSAISAPNLGRAALFVGDHDTLLSNPEGFPDWHVRLRSLQAALSLGDEALAFDIAKRFAVWDPAHEELRAAVAAMLCLGDHQSRGIELLSSMQDDRATRRYAAMARDWGDVRTLIVACAARKNLQPPPMPESPQAGQGDHLEMRAVLRLKLIEASHQRSSAMPELSKEREEQAVEWAAELLNLSPIKNGTRAALLSAVLNASPAPKAADTAEMSRVRPENGETPMLSRTALSAHDWLDSSRGLRPLLKASSYESAAAKLRELLKAEDLNPDQAQNLRTAADTLFLEALKAHALSGHKEQALALLQTEAAKSALEHEAALSYARSTVLYLSGDHRAALGEIEKARAQFQGEGNDNRDAQKSFQRASALMQRAELLAALGPPNDKNAQQEIAEAALLADEASQKSASPYLDARARWLRLSLVRPPHGQPLRPSPPVDLESSEPSGRWPWTGEIPESSLAQPWQGALTRLLTHIHKAITASPEQRLLHRYRALSRRGDSMPAPLAELSLATRLLGGDGDVELWLNTYTARHFGQYSHRHNAWLRWNAALWRGDGERAEYWKKIYLRLQKLAFEDPTKAELAAFLDL